MPPSCSFFVAYRLYIVYRQVFQVPQIFHFEPYLAALSLRSDVTSTMQILSSHVSAFDQEPISTEPDLVQAFLAHKKPRLPRTL